MKTSLSIGWRIVAVVALAAVPAGAQEIKPVATSVDPNSGSITGGVNVTVTGTNFVSGSAVGVQIGEMCTSFTLVDETEITCTTSAVAAEGEYTVIIRYKDSLGDEHNSPGTALFHVIDDGPQISPKGGIDPTKGTSGTTVHVYGTNFAADTEVVFENEADQQQRAASGYTLVNEGEFTCNPPNFPLNTWAYVRVRKPGAALSPLDRDARFQYALPLPKVNDANPKSSNFAGEAAGTQVVIEITGAFFYPDAGAEGTQVFFDGFSGGTVELEVTGITTSVDHKTDRLTAKVSPALDSWQEGPVFVRVHTPPGPGANTDLFKYLDEAPYNVQIDSPPGNAIVSGTLSVIVGAEDDRGVTAVDVRWTKQDPDIAVTPWSQWNADGVTPLGDGSLKVEWDTTAGGLISDGDTVHLRAEATDGYAGDRLPGGTQTPEREAGTLSPYISVTVDSGSPIVDNPPEVQITSHSNGETVFDVVDVVATVADDKGINSVTIYVDGVDVTSSADEAPAGTWTYQWDTKAATDGAVEIRVEAEDNCSTPFPQLAYDTVTVTVANEVDSDDDGLPDAYEDTIGTDPTKYDTDADGLSDGWEVTQWPELYPLEDPLDPTSRDTDDDGMDDGWENTYYPFTNPVVSDADGDPDADDQTNSREYRCKSDPSDAASTCPPRAKGDCLPGEPNETFVILLLVAGALAIGASARRWLVRRRPGRG